MSEEANANAGLPEAVRLSAMLAELAHQGGDASLKLDAVLQRFHTRAYGVLLMLVLLPAFIPLPVGTGAVSGPLVSLIGLQMLFGLRAPWLPQRARLRTIQRATLGRFSQRIARLLGWLERLCRPRLQGLTRSTLAHVFTGAQLLVLGILLALPIPLTNYPFGLLILAYAIAIIERDGVLLLVAWGFGLATIITWAVLSGEVITLLGRWAGA